MNLNFVKYWTHRTLWLALCCCAAGEDARRCTCSPPGSTCSPGRVGGRPSSPQVLSLDAWQSTTAWIHMEENFTGLSDCVQWINLPKTWLTNVLIEYLRKYIHIWQMNMLHMLDFEAIICQSLWFVYFLRPLWHKSISISPALITIKCQNGS